jgi:hypothetical protein
MVTSSVDNSLWMDFYVSDILLSNSSACKCCATGSSSCLHFFCCPTHGYQISGMGSLRSRKCGLPPVVDENTEILILGMNRSSLPAESRGSGREFL